MYVAGINEMVGSAIAIEAKWDMTFLVVHQGT